VAPKPIDPATCKWAQPYGVIGYTAARQIEASEIKGLTQALSKPSTDQLDAIIKASFKTLPTVYYRGGHATLDHEVWDNIGFEGTNRQWLFFQNVPAQGTDHGSMKARTQEIQEQLATAPASFFSKPTKLDEIWRQRAERTKGAPAKTARVFFAKELFEKYGTYCWLELWTPEPMRVPGADSSPPPPPQRLLEVFEERNSLFFHPSRNPFHVAAATELREALHSLAISPAMKMSRAKRKPKH
jgi:hypothetical protein